MNVVLAGNPNAGKTTLFNYLTKSRLKTGNWHGVTTTSASKTLGEINYIDAPGMYSFNAFSMEEREAVKAIQSADIIINVIDALTLQSSLLLTKSLLMLKKRVVVFVTKTKSLFHRCGRLNEDELSHYLGVPVIVNDAKKLKEYLNKNINNIPPVMPSKSSLDKAYYAGNLRLTKAESVFYNKYFSSVIFVVLIILMFFLAFHPLMPGAKLKELSEYLICDLFANFLRSNIGSELLSSLLCDGVLGGAGGVLSFIPQLAILYLFLTALDESGIISSLAFITDGLFEKVHLSGRAAFSLVSGFGCTAAAILTTRGFSEKSTQKRTVAVLSYIPCGAKLPVFLTFLSPMFANPFPAVCILYFSGLLIALVGARILKGYSENLLCEVTPIGFPSLIQTQIKLFFYLKGFIIKVVTAVMLFCVISWFLSSFSFTMSPVQTESSMLASISKAVCPIFYPMGITDWRLAYAVISGFAAKENVAATIALLMPEGTGLGMGASLAVSVFILLCPACVSAFASSVKEVGLIYSLKYYAVQLLVAFLGAYLINFLFLFF